jgi:hypothetical protein
VPDAEPVAAVQSGADDGATLCADDIKPGISEALAQLLMPSDQTSVSARTVPAAISSRSR